MTDAIQSPAFAPTLDTGTSSGARTSLNQDFDDFLKLLTTQMQNQDPLSPMESAEFTNQLVGFAGVEQQIASNEHLEELISLQKGNELNSALDYLGHEVRVAGNAVSYDGSTPVDLSIALSAGATTSTVSIVDETGDTVWTRRGPIEPGPHIVTWDGSRTEGGQAPAGDYTLRFSAFDGKGDLVDTATATFGRVTGVESADEGTLLMLGETPVRLTDVLSIRN